MAIKLPTSELVNEMKDRPYTMMTILALMFAVPYLWYTSASAGDLQKLETKFDKALAAEAKKTNRILSLQIAESIRAQQKVVCEDPDNQANQTILENLQTEYKDVVGERYPARRCQ